MRPPAGFPGGLALDEARAPGPTVNAPRAPGDEPGRPARAPQAPSGALHEVDSPAPAATGPLQGRASDPSTGA